MKKDAYVLLSIAMISIGGWFFPGTVYQLAVATRSDSSAGETIVTRGPGRWSNPRSRMYISKAVTVSKKERSIYSPDKTLLATVTTYGYIVPFGGGVTTNTSESVIRISTSKGSLISSRSFITKDHTTGITIDNVEWTKDSQFLVFNGTIQLGHQPGHVPTYFFSREKRKIHALDPYVGIWVTGGFTLVARDSIRVMVRERLPHGGFVNNLTKTVALKVLSSAIFEKDTRKRHAV